MEFWENRYRVRGLEWGTEPSIVGRTALKYLNGGNHHRILDVGCGYGRDCFFLASHGFEAVGLDISTVALSLGEDWKKRENVPNVQFVCSHINNHPFSENSFSAILIYNFMQLIKTQERQKLAADFFRLLQPGGLLIQAVFSTNEEGYGCGEPLEKNSYPTGGGRLRHFFDRQEIEKLFRAFTFLHLEEVVIPEQQTGKPPHYHHEWLMVLQKRQ
ncbi:MAG: class I SAM-dependent methyltransferase [Candidatus Schekmanbacteria bacterium]|nr:class I SAM-dependent methyltransferase [Candidatus Schekmanbacteria bacterium]